jgi:hypothetical protein
MPQDDVMRFPQITQQIECEFQGKRAFLCENLDEAVAHCVRQAAQYGGASKLSIELTFKSEGKKMEIQSALSTKIPSPKPFPIHVYVDREGRLRSEDPYQLVMSFPRSAAAEGEES